MRAALVAEGRLAELRQDAAHCRACPLWAGATQTVFGEGPADASIVFVGEQPGDQEDRLGRPFVGPAGRLFDRALDEAGLDRDKVYVTNAVKHFKFTQRGKRRLHKRPNAGEIRVCRRWLFEEVQALAPRLIVTLGATAAQSLAEKPLPIGANRGKVIELASGLRIFATIHPSYLLRVPDEAARAAEYDHFVEDLRAVRALSGKRKAAAR
ncbi:MAG TPA: UdgX family uracil-DNA binding protein [Roseiarcus sp.]|nr:UdgX family uracil-DNA binding protein [Roseiarcus sp.]